MCSVGNLLVWSARRRSKEEEGKNFFRFTAIPTKIRRRKRPGVSRGASGMAGMPSGTAGDVGLGERERVTILHYYHLFVNSDWDTVTPPLPSSRVHLALLPVRDVVT